MKKIFQFLPALISIILWTSCDKHDYARGELSPIINVERLRLLYKEGDLALTKENLDAAEMTVGTVVTNPDGGNTPEGVIAIQSERGGRIRGITLSLGASASNYSVGDSVHVKIQGATLKRVGGTLQLTGLSATAVEKIASNRPITIRSVSVINIINKPEEYEGSLVTIFGNNYTPNPGVETMLGDKVFTDGTGEMQLHVAATSPLATKFLPYSGHTTGVIFKSESGVFQIWPRTAEDFISTSIIVDPSIPLGKTPIIITGFITDPTGSDTNYEYIQMMATQDLDFNVTPFSVFTCNNAGASTPTGAPIRGWVTGDLRTYKFNITKGTAAKGTFFYVGGYKKIWGASSTDIGAANWVANTIYGSEPGADGVGSALGTGGIFANSGNGAGVAVFKGTNVDENSIPLDVIFYGGNGVVYSAGPPALGYRVTDNDLYDTKGGTQPFWNMNTTSINNKKFGFPTPTGAFSKLGGVFDAGQQKWTTPRALTSVVIGNSSNITHLESGAGTTALVAN